MPKIILSYSEFLQDQVKYPEDTKCFVYDCNKPGIYEGGDARFYCGMCEEHASMVSKYRLYLGCFVSDINKSLNGLELYIKAKERRDKLTSKLNECLEEEYGRKSCKTE